MQLVVRRSALRMWLFAILGVPFIIFGVDILGGRQLTTRLTDYIYPGENATPPVLETHELAWAWAFLVAGGLFTAWALKELIAPRRVVQGDWRGVTLGVAGPFRPATLIPWSDIEDVRAGTASDGESEFPVLVFDISRLGDLPQRPWGARWVGPNQLAIASRDWEYEAFIVATQLRELASQVVVSNDMTADDEESDDPPDAPIGPADLAGWDVLDLEPPTQGSTARGLLP
jgi:hypothetical protein